MTRRDALFVALAYVGWLVAAYTLNWLASGAHTPQALFESWVRFDGIYFRAIAEYGYAEASQRIRPDINFPFLTAFFPLFPLAIRLAAPLFNGNYSIAAVIVPQALTLCALWALFDLITLDFSRRVARLSILALIAFPTFYFLTTAYSETAFLLLVVLAFRLARTQRMLSAGIVGALAAATRIMGAPFLVGTFALDIAVGWWQPVRAGRPLRLLDRRFIPLALAPLGLAAYTGYLGWQFGDPTLFMQGHTSQEWQVGFDALGPVKGFLLPLATLVKHPWYAPEFRANLFNALFLYVGVAVAVYAWRRLPPVYSIYAVQALVLPMFTGSLISMPRYLLVSFPFFIGAGLFMDAHPRARYWFGPLALASLLGAWLYFHTVFLG
ncbi:MAG: hypothetical protein HZB53_21695 [Chloroflexi bacterium]|nr:hypothetical protein [Chloroflexota bacterium]